MNTSQAQFYGRTQSQYSTYGNQIQKQRTGSKPQLRHSLSLESDVYEFSKEPAKKINKKTKVVNAEKYNNLVKENSIFRGLAVGLSAIGLITCLSSEPAKPLDAATIHVDYGTSISQIADIYGSDTDVIMEANDLDSDKITKGRRIVIPSAYNPINDEIMALQEKLFSSNLKQEEREEIENQILNLQNEIYIQNEIAQVYSDGEFIYFKLTLPTDDTASNVQSRYNGKINVEEFKGIFNIADGAIKDNNNIGFEWTNGGTVMKYSNQDLSNGEVIKVPIDAVAR